MAARSAHAAEEQELDVTVVGRTLLAEDVVELRLARVDGSPLPAWEPGAHIDCLLDGEGLVRQYSLTGDPGATAAWTVAVLWVRDGRGGSARVHAGLDVGSTLRIRGPRHRFVLEPAKHYLFLAGGVGITPLLPMIETVDRAGAPWRLVYGGRSCASMAYRDRLRAHGDKVEIVPQDVKGLPDLRTIVGAVDEGTAVYACGPEPMLAALEELHRGEGRWSLHLERFTAGSAAVDPGGAPMEVELADSGVSVLVGAEESVLQAVERAGVFVLSSCREGVCGTCETRVLAGRVEHRDSYLTDDERAAGEVMMICVSRGTGLRLEL